MDGKVPDHMESDIGTLFGRVERPCVKSGVSLPGVILLFAE